MSFAHTSATQRRYLPPAVAVSSVAFALTPPVEAHTEPPRTDITSTTHQLWIPLVRRTRPPFGGEWALPGGPIPWDESLKETALRTLHSATHRPPSYLEQLFSFGARERSAQAQRLVTIAYWALYGEHDLSTPPSLPTPAPQPADAGSRSWDDPPPNIPPTPHGPIEPDPNVCWFPADHLPELAFDHTHIVATALHRLRSKAEYAAVTHRFLGNTFTLAQLREVHEAVRGSTVDPGNFRRQVLAQGHLTETGHTTTGTGHRPAKLYRFTEPHTDPSELPTDTENLTPRTTAATEKRMSS